MSLEADLDTLAADFKEFGDSSYSPQDMARNCSKRIKTLSTKKPTEAKVYFRYMTDEKGEVLLDCTFKVDGMFFGFFSIRRCLDQKTWSKTGRYYLTPLFGCGQHDYNCGAITGLNEAKALATLNTRLLMAAMQNVVLK